MATSRTRALRIVDPQPESPELEPVTFDIHTGEIAPGISLNDGVATIEHSDGAATIDFEPNISGANQEDSKNFYANLALKMDDGKLGEIASQLIDGIERDENSRREWLETRARGIQLLGLKLEDPRGDVGASSAPLEGMSTVRHPLLLEATIRFQSTARGELLPASGPVKIRNDSTIPPKLPKPQVPMMPPVGGALNAPGPPPAALSAPPGGGGGPGTIPALPGLPPAIPNQQGMPQPVPPMPPPAQMSSAQGAPPPPEPPMTQEQQKDELADALETDFNHYLTVTASEYVPDTDRMLFYVGFGGDGFKKVYNCPLRRRVVSETVDAEDLIVSNASTDLKNCGRVTHRIKMRKSVLRRMQILGEYRDVELSEPEPPRSDPVEQQKQEISGIRKTTQNPKDLDYEIYECYCELDLDEFAPARFKGKGLALPYRVTLEKRTKSVLSIIRNWREKDEECLSKQFFVQFPFIRGLGFYGLGFIHILGNTTNALTAMWREAVDAGMFANFPGFIYAKGLGRQVSNQLRVPPGGGVGIDVGAQQRIQDAIMPLPYKEPSPAFAAIVQHIEELGQRLGQTAEIQVGEGRQDAPVGTTMALIEQATKMLDSVHKRMHAAQAEEFGLLKERFKEDPEAFWRHNRNPSMPWQREQFLKALNDNDLVPVADPNNPTSLHRISKALALQELMKAYPQLLDPAQVLQRIMRVVGIDSEGLMRAQPASPPPDPRMKAIEQKAQTSLQQQQMQNVDSQRKAELAIRQLMDKAQDRESRERIEKLKIHLEELRLMEERIIHAHDAVQEREKHQQEIVKAAEEQRALVVQNMQKHAKLEQERRAHHAKVASDLEAEKMKAAHAREQRRAEHAMKLQQDRVAHHTKMQQAHEAHQQRIAHEHEMHRIRTEMKKAEGGAVEGFAAGGRVIAKEDDPLMKLADAFERLAKAQSAPRGFMVVRDEKTGKVIGARSVDVPQQVPGPPPPPVPVENRDGSVTISIDDEQQ